MQLARLMEPRRERSLYAKLRQIVRAIQIERQLEQGRDPRSLSGAGAVMAAISKACARPRIAYFGKEPKRLSLAEAALLVALPQSPERRRLDRHPDAARAARDRVLDRMVEDGACSRDEATQAKAEPVPKVRKPMPMLAPHAADAGDADGAGYAASSG